MERVSEDCNFTTSMDKFKKIDKEFLLTDSSLNSYGYRLLTAGYLMSEFQKNPIGYFLHADKEMTDFTRKDGVLVKWSDFRKDGDKVYAKPNINLSHPRGERTADEIENGFLNAASCGHFVVLEISNNAEDYLPNQKGPSVSKWYNRECSLVDIPGNYNALTELFDENDNPLNLKNLNFSIMTKLFFTPEQITKMNLKADADQGAVETAFNDLVAKAGRVDAAESAKKKAEDDLAELKKTTMEKEVKGLIAKALDVDNKITKELAGKLEKQFEGKPAELKDLLDALPVHKTITSQLNGEQADIAKKTWDQLDKEGKLEDLKAKDFDLFKQKYKAQFNKDYAGK